MHISMNAAFLRRFDRFTEAFEHVSGVIDDIYKVHIYHTIATFQLHKSKGH